MKIVGVCLLAGFACGFGGSAFAQQSIATPGDVKYCNALARTYQSMQPVQEGMPASDVVTLSQCESNPRQTIAVLEKKLTDKKIALPHDNRIAEQPGSSGNR
jgi:hypothetical protein